MKSFLIILGLLFLALVSRAQDLSDFESKRFSRWNGSNFNHEQEILREEARGVWRQMQMPMKCRPAAYGIAETLYGYRKDLSQHHDDVAKAKVAKALAILQTQNECFNSVAAFYSFWSVDAGLIDIEYRLPLFIELFKRGKLVPVRQSERIDHDEILGAYQCKTSTIYFNPFRGPEDLANILNHELSHLIRDKFLSHADLLRDAPHLTAIEYAIVDETLAVLTGTLPELTEDRKWHREFDLSLFHDDGALVGSILAANRGAAEPSDNAIRPSYMLGRYMAVVGLQPEYGHYLRELIKLVASVYTPAAEYRFGVLTAWLKKYDYAGEQFWTMPQSMFWSWAANSNYKTIDNVLNYPSTVCEQFKEEIRKGELTNYLGTHSQSGRNEKPGTEGIKPGVSGAKLDLSEIRFCRPPPPEL